MRNKKTKNDVGWYIPKRKTPIAYTTKATSELIVALSEHGMTIADVMKQIHYDKEAKEVLRQYIARGYGDIEARKFFG